jgi:hypothetical protein
MTKAGNAISPRSTISLNQTLATSSLPFRLLLLSRNSALNPQASTFRYRQIPGKRPRPRMLRRSLPELHMRLQERTPEFMQIRGSMSISANAFLSIQPIRFTNPQHTPLFLRRSSLLVSRHLSGRRPSQTDCVTEPRYRPASHAQASLSGVPRKMHTRR